MHEDEELLVQLRTVLVLMLLSMFTGNVVEIAKTGVGSRGLASIYSTHHDDIVVNIVFYPPGCSFGMFML